MRMKVIVTICFVIFICMLLKLNLKDHEKYLAMFEEKMAMVVSGGSARRGRILDCNGKVLVDNVGTLNIVYHKSPDISVFDELDIARALAFYVGDYRVSDDMKRDYYLLLHNNGDDLISDSEYQLLRERKLTSDDILRLKKERIKDSDLVYSELEEKLIYLFYLMNNGYYYQDKYLFYDIDEESSLKIMENNLKGIRVVVGSKRVYPYADTLRGIFGSVGSIPKEDVSYYLDNGYSLEDVVGISGLEKTYENELKGEKSTYYVNSDYSLEKISDEVMGHDIVLNIDIDLQLFLENVLKDELNKAHLKKQSKFFHEAYSVIGEPFTGHVMAMSGVRRNDDGSFQEITSTMLSSSFAMGSVVKGASITVGYQTNSIDVGKKMLDSCVKLYYQPLKCSYKRLGYVDDITALKTSSNYFQFITAIRSTGNTYHYNMQFDVTEDNFSIYRNTFATYGLGSLTNIDLPNEKNGIIGDKVSGDLLLNLAIGQYDTYTPIQLFQYINTIATRGKRMKLLIGSQDVSLLNEVYLDSVYYDRILEGFYQVFHGGTATNYASSSLNVAGKTGTSETFYDSNFDGVVDTKTINSTLALFFPRENPKYSMVIIAPNITYSDTYTYPFTKNVSLKMTDYLEEE